MHCDVVEKLPQDFRGQLRHLYHKVAFVGRFVRLAACLYADIVRVFQYIRYTASRPPIGKVRVAAGMAPPKLAVGVFRWHKHLFPFQTLCNLFRPHAGSTQVEDMPHLFRRLRGRE